MSAPPDRIVRRQGNHANFWREEKDVRSSTDFKEMGSTLAMTHINDEWRASVISTGACHIGIALGDY